MRRLFLSNIPVYIYSEVRSCGGWRRQWHVRAELRLLPFLRFHRYRQSSDRYRAWRTYGCSRDLIQMKQLPLRWAFILCSYSLPALGLFDSSLRLHFTRLRMAPGWNQHRHSAGAGHSPHPKDKGRLWRALRILNPPHGLGG